VNVWYQRLKLTKDPNPQILTPDVLRRAWIGEDYWHVSLKSIPDGYSYKKTIQWYIALMHIYAPGGYGLILQGPFGSGKTAIGSIILKEALMRRARCLSIRCSAMIDKLWAKRPTILPNGAPLRIALENVTYLLLDDFEVFDSKAKNRAVEEILKTRSERKLPTIIATNLEWQKVLDERYLDSLLNDRYYPVPVTGIDWRKNPPGSKTR
jgi:DNA replication protein DnaC